MTASIYRTEMARLWREPRLRWIGLVLVALLATAFLADWARATRLAEDRRQLGTAERARWLAQGEKDPHSAAHWGVWAAKPSSPLAVLEPGIEPFVGLSVWLEAHKRNDMIFRPQQDAHPLMRSAMSVGQWMAWLGPVVAILIGFSGFAEDRERGTLRMALANGTRPARLLATRVAAMLTLLMGLVIAPPMLMGVLAIARLPDAGWHGGLRLLLWSAAHAVHLTTFLLLSLAVSLKARRASLALAVLLVAWAVLCVVLPRAASDAALSLAPLPSYQQVRSQIELQAPAYESAERWEERRRAILAAAGATDEKSARVDVRAAQLDQSERDAHPVIDRLMGHFHDAMETQDLVFGRLAVLTPTAALQSIGPALAGTDFLQHRHFIDSAESYRRGLVNRMNGELMRRQGSQAKSGPDLWADTPAFDYRAPSPLEAWTPVATPLLLLLAWCAVAAAAACQATRKLMP